ncbi:hypothetical protein PDTK01_34140 [Phycicoccus sp. DTK01]|nr:hypothetical protein PDTK01_34140 [Phycicoccus sp. DTK01]
MAVWRAMDMVRRPSVPVGAHERVEEVAEEEQADDACEEVFPHAAHHTSGPPPHLAR